MRIITVWLVMVLVTLTPISSTAQSEYLPVLLDKGGQAEFAALTLDHVLHIARRGGDVSIAVMGISVNDSIWFQDFVCFMVDFRSLTTCSDSCASDLRGKNMVPVVFVEGATIRLSGEDIGVMAGHYALHRVERREVSFSHRGRFFINVPIHVVYP
jgi:hypothetical protein